MISHPPISVLLKIDREDAARSMANGAKLEALHDGSN